MKYAYQSNIGRRLRNEDNFHVPGQQGGTEFVAVADGMGGHAAGMHASELAIEGLCTHLTGITPHSPHADVIHAVDRVNRLVFEHAQKEPGCRGMGTTLTLAVLDENHYLAANVGDSRLYHFDGQAIAQITTDHSLVASLVASGNITREEAHSHPQRNIITRALGTRLTEDIDIFDNPWKEGDILLLCSDGLHGSVSDEQICAVLAGETSLQNMCDTLVALALEAGASDNITVVLARNEGGVSV